MNGSEELVSQFTSSAMIVYALEHLKKAGWFPWITEDTKTLNRWLCALGSAAAAIGIHYTFDGSVHDGGTLVLSIPPLASLLHGCWHWAQQYALTQITYDAAVAKKG